MVCAMFGSFSVHYSIWSCRWHLPINSLINNDPLLSHPQLETCSLSRNPTSHFDEIPRLHLEPSAKPSLISLQAARLNCRSMWRMKGNAFVVHSFVFSFEGIHNTIDLRDAEVEWWFFEELFKGTPSHGTSVYSLAGVWDNMPPKPVCPLS